jgi:hypothetical protein
MTPGPDDLGPTEVLAQEPAKRRIPRSLLLAGVTALTVATGAGVATAAALSPPPPSPTPTATDAPAEPPTASPSDTPSEPGRRHGWGMGRRLGFGFGGGIHGEYVVPDGEGKYITVATQFGDVTAIDGDSVTVKSEDGYTKEYVINSETRVSAGREGATSVQNGDKVLVKATVSGDTATAVAVIDTTRPARQGWEGKGHRHHGGRPGGPDPGGPGQTATPAPAPTSTS